MLAPQVRLLCPEQRGASRYFSLGYMARASQPKKKRRKSKKTKETVIADPAEASAPPLVAVVAPRLVHPPQHRMHIDYAHSITLGRNKELYYLIIVIDSIDFTWAQPSLNRSELEDLILI
jgi:hypothetical protein